ncbi:MAG: site-2 protease family protein [Candidatus Roizmanbacteria bacterium]|nr:site-2 protease family protein [Candidatus Roizmanbacteria bacterium]
MLFDLFSSFEQLLIVVVALLSAITIHEFAHAWVADRLGDPTPKLMGRVTLNPLAHLDPIGTIALLLIGFGWGKPVQFDPYNLENPRRDSALVALAGPASNVVLIALLTLLYRIFDLPILIPFIGYNVVLALFNLIPIHPLDGFKIVGGILPEDQSEDWYRLERYGMYLLLIILLPIFNGQSLVSQILGPLLDIITTLLLG